MVRGCFASCGRADFKQRDARRRQPCLTRQEIAQLYARGLAGDAQAVIDLHRDARASARRAA